jgi:hypothetical protein
MQKCRELWRMARLNNDNIERITQICGISLPVPTTFNWKIEYDCLSALAKVEEERPGSLRQCCESLGIPALEDVDIVFLKEYCTVSRNAYYNINIGQISRNSSFYVQYVYILGFRCANPAGFYPHIIIPTGSVWDYNHNAYVCCIND